MGPGFGQLRLAEGQVIDASWNVSCDGDAQVVDLIISSYENEAIPEVSLSIRVNPPSAHASGRIEIGQQKVDDGATPATTIEEKTSVSGLFRSGLEAQQGIREALRQKLAEVEASIKSFVDSDRTPVQQIVQTSSKENEQPLPEGHIETTHFDAQEQSVEDDGFPWISREALHEFAIGISAVALIGLLVFAGLHYLYHNRHEIRQRLIERRARRRARWFRSWAERRAARAARRQAIRNFFAQIFRSLMDFDAEKRAAEDERRAALIARQGAAPQADTSVAEELAGFRAAASMVSDIVAAEEGRAQRGVQMSSLPSRTLTQTDIPGFVTYNDVLPPYEEPAQDSSVVADGFRYQSEEATYSPQIQDATMVADGFRYQPNAASQNLASAPGDNSSDRLGYNK